MLSQKRLKPWINVLAVAALGTLLAACAHNDFATLSEGACKAFPRPEYQIKGKTAYDQNWADKTTEAGVAGCHWRRPKARPTSIEQVPVPAPRPTFLQRLRNKL